MMARAGYLIVPLRCFHERHREALRFQPGSCARQVCNGDPAKSEARMSNTSRTYASHRPVALYNNTVVHENLVVSTELVKVQSCQLREDITRTRPPPRHFLLLSLQSMPALLVVTSPSFSIEEVRVDRSSSSRSTCKTSQVHPTELHQHATRLEILTLKVQYLYYCM